MISITCTIIQVIQTNCWILRRYLKKNSNVWINCNSNTANCEVKHSWPCMLLLVYVNLSLCWLVGVSRRYRHLVLPPAGPRKTTLFALIYGTPNRYKWTILQFIISCNQTIGNSCKITITILFPPIDELPWLLNSSPASF